jgi:hypothetical protein
VLFKARQLAAGLWLLGGAVNGPISAAVEGDRATFRIGTTQGGIRIDGILDESEWQAAPTLELAYESYPSDNTPAPLRTEVWLAFDDESLYVDFRAFDSSPSEIRARFRERDGNSVNDDSVGIAIEPFDDGRRAFKFYSTSLGVQTDFIVDEVERERLLLGHALALRWEDPNAWERCRTGDSPLGSALPRASRRTGLRNRRCSPPQRRDFKRFSLTPLPRGETCFSLCRPARLVGIEGSQSGLRAGAFRLEGSDRGSSLFLGSNLDAKRPEHDGVGFTIGKWKDGQR